MPCKFSCCKHETQPWTDSCFGLEETDQQYNLDDLEQQIEKGTRFISSHDDDRLLHSTNSIWKIVTCPSQQRWHQDNDTFICTSQRMHSSCFESTIDKLEYHSRTIYCSWRVLRQRWETPVMVIVDAINILQGYCISAMLQTFQNITRFRTY